MLNACAKMVLLVLDPVILIIRRSIRSIAPGLAGKGTAELMN